MQLLFYLINIVVDGIYQRSWCSSSGWSSSATLSSTVFVRVPAAYPVTYTVLWKLLVAQTFHVGDWDSSKNTQSVLWNWFHHQIRLWNLPSVFWEFFWVLCTESFTISNHKISMWFLLLEFGPRDCNSYAQLNFWLSSILNFGGKLDFICCLMKSTSYSFIRFYCASRCTWNFVIMWKQCSTEFLFNDTLHIDCFRAASSFAKCNEPFVCVWVLVLVYVWVFGFEIVQFV